MTRSLLFLSAILLQPMLRAQFNWQWARQLTGEIQPSMNGLVVDADGNTVVCGDFYGTLTLGALPALTSAGQSDLFVAKFSSDGTPLWVRSAGGANFDGAFDVAVDGEGRITITGYFESPSISFGSATLNKLGNMDILVAQYDGNGTSLWAQRYGWTANNGVEWGRAIVADANNDLYVAGQYKTALQVTGLPELDACNNREQGFLMKLDANGNGLWSLRPQCTSDQSLGQTVCTALALDPDGDVYLSGDFRGDTAFFATDTLPNFMPSGQSDDAFVVKYSPDGEELWVKTWAGFNYDEIKSIATDSEGNLIVATTREGGYLIDGIDLPHAGTLNVYDITLWKVDPQGTAVWGLRAGNGLGPHELLTVDVDVNDHIWVGGFFQRNITIGTFEIPDGGSDVPYSLLIAHLDVDGTVQDAYVNRAVGPVLVQKLVCGGAGELYVAGGYNDAITFAPLAPLTDDGSFVLKGDDLTTGMATVPSDRTWSVAPVPADRHVVINAAKGEALGDLRVLDAFGREVLRTSTQAASITIDCAGWPAGSYIVQGEQLRERIMVVH
ncbi:MAG: hypothetical protein JNN32_11935 [Flavobacteriales bacterium]|nr:hypothetical protein [Flavobacteriales bacterium]